MWLYDCVYKKKFKISDPSTITDMLMNIDYGDGSVAYINGVEMARADIPGGTPDYDTNAGSGQEAGIPVRQNPSFFLGPFVDNTVSTFVDNTMSTKNI